VDNIKQLLPAPRRKCWAKSDNESLTVIEALDVRVCVCADEITSKIKFRTMEEAQEEEEEEEAKQKFSNSLSVWKIRDVEEEEEEEESDAYRLLFLLRSNAAQTEDRQSETLKKVVYKLSRRRRRRIKIVRSLSSFELENLLIFLKNDIQTETKNRIGSNNEHNKTLNRDQ